MNKCNDGSNGRAVLVDVLRGRPALADALRKISDCGCDAPSTDCGCWKYTHGEWSSEEWGTSSWFVSETPSGTWLLRRRIQWHSQTVEAKGLDELVVLARAMDAANAALDAALTSGASE